MITVGINQRVSLRKFIDDIRRWVGEGKSDDWIASALGTTPSSVQSFRSRNGIYRKDAGYSLDEKYRNPAEYEAFEGVVEVRDGKLGIWFDPAVGDDPRWNEAWGATGKVEVHLTPGGIVLIRQGERSEASGESQGT